MSAQGSAAGGALFPAQCAHSPLAAFVTLLVGVINTGQEAERRRRAATSEREEVLWRGKEYDVIVVGGGTSGSILAARLSENGRRNVLLLERGGTEPTQARVPGFAIANLQSEIVHNIQAAAEPQNCNGTGCVLQVPSVLGGGSSVNGFLVARGNKVDYEQWAELSGDSSWNHTNVLQYFKRAEDNLDIAINWDTDYHSVNGPQKVSWQPYRHPVLHVIAKAYDDIGTPSILDFNAGRGQLGYSVGQTITAAGERWSTFRSYLLPAMRRLNLRVETFATARRVLFDDNGSRPRATGVEYLDAAGKVRQARAKEVVISAGSLLSPQILMMSGIGPAEHLKELGVPLRVDLPVGQGLMDHPRTVGLVLQCDQPLCEASWEKHRQDIHDYADNRSGPLTQGFLQLTSFHRLNETATEQPDLQFLFMGFLQVNGTEQCAAADSWRLNRVAVMPIVLHPRSRGSVRLNATTPWGPPIVNLGYLSDDEKHDEAVMLEGLRLGLQLARRLEDRGFRLDPSPAAAQGCGDEEFGSDAYLLCLARRSTNTMWHWAGTCSMGQVVDSALRVLGVDGLRVADASVMPGLPSGNTNMPTIMVAERAADLVKADWK